VLPGFSTPDAWRAASLRPAVVVTVTQRIWTPVTEPLRSTARASVQVTAHPGSHLTKSLRQQ
jgi:hypothetical protein